MRLLMHHWGGNKVGVDASGVDSPLRQGAEIALQIGFRDGGDSVSKLGKEVCLVGFLVEENNK